MCKIHTKEDILKDVAEAGDNTSAHFFEFGSLSFGVVYKRKYIAGQDHFGFMAMSTGLEKITETGYRSVFVNAHSGEATEEEIKEYWIKYALEQDINMLDPAPRQPNLF